MQGVWSHRGYLPHYDQAHVYQSITYRLADSLPKNALLEMELALDFMPEGEKKVARRKRQEELLDAGHGSCVLKNPECAGCVVSAWKHFHGQRYDLVAWVVMPNHVHVLIRPRESWTLARIVHSWKSYTARRINLMCSADCRTGVRRSREAGERLWQRDYWDRYVRDEDHFNAVLEYIHANPVKALLVEKPADWPWSSAAPDQP